MHAHTAGLSLATVLLGLAATASAAPIALPGFAGTFNLPVPGRQNSLFPGGVAGAFADAFKSTNLGNSEFTCSRNGLPCGAAPDEADTDADDGTTRVTKGGLSRDEFTDAAGVGHTVVSGEIYNSESASFADAAFSDEDALDADADDVQFAQEFQAADRSHTCTRNGVPCGQFVDGTQQELKIERTASCTRNGVPCADYVDGRDDAESFTINKSNDSQKSCTRNGMPCDEYERLKEKGELPEETEFRVTSGGNAGKEMLDETVQRGEGKVGARPINVNN
ncbi:hypothetical protein EV426DRAFT_672912 [Tirmania nivea]|nr:hypothetical protein EV426DRAFT_672912 [Tirmania nivea]